MVPCKILIIDDDTDDVEILAEAFQSSGVDRVHYIHTAMQAFIYLESLENKEDLPKLIVTDMHLPGITGHEFLTDLRSMELYKHLPIVVLSSQKTEQQIEKAKQLGILEYIEKPYTYAEYVKVAEAIKLKLDL